MPNAKLPFGGAALKNVLELGLNENNYQIIDGYLDEIGAVNKRPGLAAWLDLGLIYPVHGLYYWEQQDMLLIVCNGAIYKVTYLGTPSATLISGATLLPNQRVNFANSGDRVLMANGNKIVYTDGSTATEMADVDAPTRVSHIAYLDGYILANDYQSATWYYSDVNNVTSWNALNFASSAGSPDYTTALKVFQREIYLFGPQSIEIWENNGEDPFARIPGGFVESGCTAPNSVVVTENAIYWLDERAHLVTFSGRGVERVSSAFDAYIAKFGTVDDCLGDKIEVAGNTFLLFSFPAADKTLVFNLAQGNWTEFGKWDSVNFRYGRFIGNCYAYARRQNLNLFGSSTTGEIYRFDPDTYQDDGDKIRFLIRTGHIDHATLKQKRNNELLLRARRGAASVTDPKLMLRWRDNGRADWSNIHELSLLEQGNTDIPLRFQRAGIYRTRQWELSCSDNVPVTILEAEEDFDFLR